MERKSDMEDSNGAPMAGWYGAEEHRNFSGSRRRRRGVAGALLVFLLLEGTLLGGPVAEAFSLGTWSIESFTLRGKDRYVAEDMAHVAQTILRSQAAVVALQEIEGVASLRALTLNHLSGWRYAGHDTRGRQDLFFLWDTRRAGLLWGPEPYLTAASFCWKEKSLRLFDRPPLVAVFLDMTSGRTLTLVNVHLKGGNRREREDEEKSSAYDRAKRDAQIQRLNELVRSLRGPVFICGNFNANPVRGTSFSVWTLTEGFSWDGAQKNFDAVGYQGLSPAPAWRIFEVEGAVPRRSSSEQEHPDRDLVVLDLGDLSPVSADAPRT